MAMKQYLGALLPHGLWAHALKKRDWGYVYTQLYLALAQPFGVKQGICTHLGEPDIFVLNRIFVNRKSPILPVLGHKIRAKRHMIHNTRKHRLCFLQSSGYIEDYS